MPTYFKALPADLLPQLFLYLSSEELKTVLFNNKLLDVKSLINSKIFWDTLWKRDISSFTKVPDRTYRVYSDLSSKLSSYSEWKQIDYLASMGYDILLYPLIKNQKDSNWAAANAAVNGHIDIVKTLMTFSDGRINNFNEIAEIAATYGHLEIIKLIPEYKLHDYSTIVRIATSNGHIDIVETYLDKVDPEYYWSFLEYAVCGNNLELIKLLLRKNARITFESFNNALKKGNRAVIELLLEHRNLLFSEECVKLYSIGLKTAIERNHKDIVELLLEKHNLFVLERAVQIPIDFNSAIAKANHAKNKEMAEFLKKERALYNRKYR